MVALLMFCLSIYLLILSESVSVLDTKIIAFLEIRIFENVIKPILTNGTKN
jgi:hypothetical protein